MDPLQPEIDREAVRTRFSGVVRVDREGERALEAAYGLADRAHGIPMTPAHQLGTASLTKGFTAVAVVALVVAGKAQAEISASNGWVTGEGLVTAAKWVSWINIALTIVGIVVALVFLLAVGTASVSTSTG
jgi:hypothetical protein